MRSLVILISGSGSNMTAILQAAQRDHWAERYNARVAAVISNQADASGLTLAREAGLATAVVSHQAFAHHAQPREAFDAALVAEIDRYQPALVVLAGGESKQGTPHNWLAALGQKAAAVVLFGAAQAEFQRLLTAAGFPGAVHCCEGLDTGVGLAAQLARTHQCAAVLLSPACASFDQYSDFEARGDHFRRLVAEL